MERTEENVEDSLSNGSLKSDSDVSESSESSSESDNSPRMNGLDTDKLDPNITQREILEKLKRQELEEREEIERELKAHKEALARHEELLARERHIKELQRERERELRSEHSPEDLRHKSRSEIFPHHDLKAASLELLNRQAYLERAFSRSPTRSDLLSPHSDGPAHHWTYEEQFKQLYELSDDPKRKEFLDELFDYMQKRGTPVNRIPIMAKQTLDLYELFKLVVSKGGLVEVINKKLWREITKGLNLPSSITSAAFTLRTQYMKYLYPFECEKLKLSTPGELQAAIDGNRREGRRPSYGYELTPTTPTLLPPHHLNGGLLNGFSPAALASLNGTMNGGLTLAGLNGGLSTNVLNGGSERSGDTHKTLKTPNGSSSSHSSGDQPQDLRNKGDDDSLPTSPNHIRTPLGSISERDALAMEAASRAMEEATRKMEAMTRAAREAARESEARKEEDAPKKLFMPPTEQERLLAHAGMPSAHLKVTSRNDGTAQFDNSLVVSMEINGIMYQGVLFAQHARRL